MKKFLIYGGKGWIGSKFIKYCLDFFVKLLYFSSFISSRLLSLLLKESLFKLTRINSDGIYIG